MTVELYELLINKEDTEALISGVQEAMSVEGDLAEVGVYKGGTAKVICDFKGNRNLYLFDTFKGLEQTSYLDKPNFKDGMYASDIETAKYNLRNESNVHIYEGWFPDTAGDILDKRFSFVNLDTDIYLSTKGCLEFFYPRMNKGGIIMIHDYSQFKGITLAVDEFMEYKPEIIEKASEYYGKIRKV